MQVVCTINYGRKPCGRHREIAKQMKTAEDAEDAKEIVIPSSNDLCVLSALSGFGSRVDYLGAVGENK